MARLPDAALVGLRDAFAGEVAERLPRLRTAARSRDPDLLEAALRDVHTLGSGAYVVGEDAAAVTARAAEVALLAGDPDEEFPDLVRTLDAQLATWLR